MFGAGIRMGHAALRIRVIVEVHEQRELILKMRAE